MKYEELKHLLGQCIENHDLLVENAETILNAFKEADDTTIAVKTELENLKEKNNDLRDTNVKLLMRQTFDAPKDEPEETPEQILDRLTNKILGGNE